MESGVRPCRIIFRPGLWNGSLFSQPRFLYALLQGSRTRTTREEEEEEEEFFNHCL